MASSDSVAAVKFLAIAVVVITGSAIAGYFLAGSNRSTQTLNNVQVAADTSAPIPSSADTTQTTVAKQNEDYTAPNSPKIQIQEEKPVTPKAAATDQTATAIPDTEASQEAPPPPVASPATDDSADSSLTSPVTGNTTNPSTAAPPTDPDYEQTNSSDNTGDNAAAPPPPPRVLYRVLVASFDQAKNAHMLADVLRNRGYTTSTGSGFVGSKTVYHVQAGAFRTKAAAEKVAQTLQSSGYPASVVSLAQ